MMSAGGGAADGGPGGPSSGGPEVEGPPATEDVRPSDDGMSGINRIDAGAPPEVAPGLPMRGGCPREEGGLRLCLRFEGNLYDESEGPQTVSGRLVRYAPGPSGQAATVGLASEILVASAASLNPSAFTIEAWINPERLPVLGGRAGIVDSQGRFGLFVTSGGGLACSARGTMVSIGSAVKAGEWSSIACTWSGSEVALWVAGRRRAGASAPSDGNAAAQSLTIGSNNPLGDNFIGALDNVRLWGRVRTEGQICNDSIGCE